MRQPNASLETTITREPSGHISAIALPGDLFRLNIRDPEELWSLQRKKPSGSCARESRRVVAIAAFAEPATLDRSLVLRGNSDCYHV
jgi:hypothetical protein